jgi:uridine phosphorylase
MCATMGLRAGMVAGVLVNRTQQEIPDTTQIKASETTAVDIVIAAARQLV